MPDAPVAITPDWTPSTPSAPGAISSNFTPGSPTAPAVIGGSFTPGSPSAPAAISSAPQAPVAGFRMIVSGSPLIDVVLVPAFINGVPAGLSSSGGTDLPPNGRWVQAQDIGGIWTVAAFLDGENDANYTADAEAATLPEVELWTLDPGQVGQPVFTATHGLPWPPMIADKPGDSVSLDAPAAISGNFTPGTPSAPPVIST